MVGARGDRGRGGMLGGRGAREGTGGVGGGRRNGGASPLGVGGRPRQGLPAWRGLRVVGRADCVLAGLGGSGRVWQAVKSGPLDFILAAQMWCHIVHCQ